MRVLFGCLVVQLLVHTTAGVEDAAGQSDLPAPGPVVADTTYGSVGDWFTVRPYSGEDVPYEALRNRVLFVNFWATWCAPCVQEMPTIDDLAASMTGHNVAFLLISIDDDEHAARRFAEERGLSRYVYFRGWEPWTSTFPAGIVPATFVVSKDGSITYQHHGAADWNAPAIRHYLIDLENH